VKRSLIVDLISQLEVFTIVRRECEKMPLLMRSKAIEERELIRIH